jgi:hypothetical protein
MWIQGLNQGVDFRLAYGATYADANVKMTVSTTGLVGIGNTTPQSALDVRADDSGTGFSANNGQFRIINANTTANNWAGIKFADLDGTGFDAGIGVQ